MPPRYLRLHQWLSYLRHHQWIAYVLVFGLAVVLASILLRREPADAPLGEPAATRNEIRIPILASSALQTLDPIKSAELVQYNLDLQIFECLVAVGASGEIVPSLAEKWESSPDFRVWTFHLRDASFTDDPSFPGNKGRRVTADDVIFSWKRGLSPKLGSLNSWALSASVAGAEKFASGGSDDVLGLERVDDRTIRVRLTEPDRDFLARLTVLSTAVVPPEAVKFYGDQFGSHPVGTGPFKLKEWVPSEYVLLERNPQYGRGEGWQPRSPTVAQARFIFFRSEAQIANEFDRGTVDVRDVAGADLAQLSDITSLEEIQRRFPKALVVRPGKVCRLHLLAPLIGEQYAFGASPALRRSLTATFDHEQLVKSAIGPLGKTIKSLMLPPDVLFDAPPWTDAPIAQSDPSSYSSLRGRTVKVAYVSSRVDDVIVALLQQWLEKRGATVRLFPSASINALFASVGDVKPDLTLIYWSPYYPNVANYLTALLSASRPVPNFTGFSNPALDRAAKRLKSAVGEEGQKVHLEIKTILDSTMPWIPLYYETPLMLTKPYVRNFKINPVSVMLLADAEVGPTGTTEKRGQ